MTVAGGLLMLQALRIAARRPADHAPARRHASRRATLLALVVAVVARALARANVGGEQADATAAIRLSLAPRVWPARLVATAAQQQQRRPAHAALSLGELLHGLQATVGLLGAAAAFAVADKASGAAIGIVVAAALGAVAAALPVIILAGAARHARRLAVLHAPAVLDTLAAASAAGLGLHAALQAVAALSHPGAGAPLRAAAVRCSTGESPEAALAEEARRFALPALADAATAVDRHRRLGVALAPELRQLAAASRAEARSRLLEKAARRGPLGTLVVALVIAPICLAALTTCLVGGLVEGGSLPLR